MADVVTDATFDREVLASDRPVIVKFTAPWCRPCRHITPVLEAIANAQGEALRLVELDIDENLGVPARYSVLSIPTVILFSKGEALAKVVGAAPRRRFDEAFAPYLDAAEQDV
jgi:thioredoxin 1